MIDREYVKKIAEAVLIEHIVLRVTEKLAEHNKRALVLFTGASIGFMQSVKSLRKLKGSGWKLTAVMSEGAENVLGSLLLKDMLSLKDIYTEASHPDIKGLIDSHSFIVIPSMTINTASKIANCISDSLVTNIVLSSMKAGKSIIASLDACCPDNPERNAMGFHVTEAYKDRLRSNLDILRSYGILLTTSENLEKKVSSSLMKEYGAFVKNADMARPGRSGLLQDRVISRGCVLKNSGFSEIRIRRDALVTDLARDEAAKLNIKFVKE